MQLLNSPQSFSIASFPQGNKEVKSSKSAVADIPTGGTRSIKSMWEKGNISSSSESPAPTVKVSRREGGRERGRWMTDPPLSLGCGGHQRGRGFTAQQLEGKECGGGEEPCSCSCSCSGPWPWTSSCKTSSKTWLPPLSQTTNYGLNQCNSWICQHMLVLCEEAAYQHVPTAIMASPCLTALRPPKSK